MAERRVHLEAGARSQQAIAAWQNVFTQYFNPINGTGRAWAMWTTPPRTSLTKFRKSVMAGLEFHSAAFVEGEVAPTQVQILVKDLMVERNAVVAAMEAAVGQQVQHQGLLRGQWRHRPSPPWPRCSGSLLIYYALPVVCTSRYILLAKRSLLTKAQVV